MILLQVLQYHTQAYHAHTHKLPPDVKLCMGTTRDGIEYRIIRNNSGAITGPVKRDRWEGERGWM